jgi:hypothetical protein
MLLPAIARHLSMKTRLHLTCWLTLLLSWLALSSLRAGQFGPYTYSISGTGNTAAITITQYDGNVAGIGPADVPESIDGVPVIAIGDSAFSGNANLTELTLPTSITSIGNQAFYYCTGLKSVSLPSSITSIGNMAFFNCVGLTSLPLPNSLTSIGAGVFYRCTGLTSLYMPASIISIGYAAFYGCTGLRNLSLPASIKSIDRDAFRSCYSLTHLSVPSSLESIGDLAFGSCLHLRTAFFSGNAPGGRGPFDDNWLLRVYYLKEKTGFDSFYWRYFRPTMIDPTTQPAATWLLANGQAYNADLNTDFNKDGVSLLMAYALNLDPRLDLSGRLPQATLQGDTLGMTFYAASPGLTYRVEASADLIHWSTDGITQSPLNRRGMSTVTVPRSGAAQFLRLAVSR